MSPAPTGAEDKLSFEESLETIRTIVNELESGELSLEESIEKYRDGSRLIENTRRLIADAELRITELSVPDDLD